MDKWKKIENTVIINPLKDLALTLTEASKVYVEIEVGRIKQMTKALNDFNKAK